MNEQELTWIIVALSGAMIFYRFMGGKTPDYDAADSTWKLFNFIQTVFVIWLFVTILA